MNYNNLLIEEWPNISFKEIEDIPIDNKTLRFTYKSFFTFLHLPETTLRAFFILFTGKVI